MLQMKLGAACPSKDKMVHETHSEKKIQKHETKPLTGGSYSMGEVIVITSGKGGVGKTTTTAKYWCGTLLVRKEVIVIDTDSWSSQP